MTTIAGGCYCGAVRFEITEELRVILNCHCRNCRRAHGAPFYAFAFLNPNNFRVTTGEEHVAGYEFTPGYTRNFCRVCGGRLFNYVPTGVGPLINVALSTLDEEPPRGAIQAHINVETKAPWHVIGDDRPQYDDFGPDFTKRLEEVVAD